MVEPEDQYVPPMMRAALEAAEAKVASLGETTIEEAPEPQTPQEEQLPVDDSIQGQDEEPSSEQIVETVVEDQKPTPQPTVSEAEYRKLEQQYKTLKGKYDAEVPRLSTALREQETESRRMSEDLAQTRQTIEDLQRQLEDATTDPVKRYGLTEEEAQMPEVVSAMEKIARKELGRRKEKADDGRGQEIQAALRRVYLAELDFKVEGWRDLNTDNDFNEWLDEEDPLYGVARRKAFDAANESNNAEKVAKFFNTFKGLRQPPAPVVPVKASLESQVMPARNAAPPAPKPAKKTWKQSEWNERMNWVASQIGKNSEAVQALEKELLAAEREKRILRGQ